MRLSLNRRAALPIVAAFSLLMAGSALAQEALRDAAPREAAPSGYLHLNVMVEKFAAGKAVIGTSTGDWSMENAKALARSDFDFVRLEGEHRPLNMELMRDFLIGMIDKQTAVKKGNAQPNVAVISRFPPYGAETQGWLEKNALDIGLMGYVFNGVDNAQQALTAVRYMRYPQRKGSAHFEPNGLRGFGPFNAAWYWGVGTDEYMEHADVWPLNPKGDLLAVMMIETVEGLKNVDKIAAVPGVGMIFPGNATDLYLAMGVAADSPEREQAMQTILAACKRHNVPCGVATSLAEAPKRIMEGWKYIELNGVPVDSGVKALKQ